MNQEPDRSTWAKKLLVEGNDDLHVVAHIRNSYALSDNFEIVDCKSVGKVKPKLLSYFKARSTTIMGIIVDADADTDSVDDALTARWNSLRDVLIAQGYEVPESPSEDGTIIQGTGRNPRVGIWLMPNNVQKPGMLEHFVATLIPPHDILKPIAEQTLKQIEHDGLNRYNLIHTSKALIHTWLAWQEDPGTPMGLAIKKTYLDYNTELCKRFVNWLDSLFNK